MVVTGDESGSAFRRNQVDQCIPKSHTFHHHHILKVKKCI